MTRIVREVTTPSLVEIAQAELGVGRERLPGGDTALRGAVLGEIMRAGLYALFKTAGAPVHELSLRAWLDRKLGALFDGSDLSEEQDYRQVLLGGRGQSLELVGDALILPHGLVSPAPSRIIPIGGQTSLLLSGIPSHLLGELRPYLVFTNLGRRLQGVDADTLAKMGWKAQRVESYLGVVESKPVTERLRELLDRDPDSIWHGGDDWEAYLGNRGEGSGRPLSQYGFLWSRTSSRVANPPLEVEVAKSRMSLWREPVSSRFCRFWIKLVSPRGQFAVNVPLTDWKLVAIAMDFEAHKSRVASIVKNTGEGTTSLAVGFPPYWKLYRLIHLLGGELEGRRTGRDVWRLPTLESATVKNLLESDGVLVEARG